MTAVKICGLKDSENLEAAIEAGTDYVGLVFYDPSPRAVSVDQAAELVTQIPDSVKTVGLFVDPSDSDLERILSRVKLDILQLHGDETPARILDVKQKFDFEIIKALRIASKNDLKNIKEYEEVSDYLMFDARVEGESLPGGMGQAFDWDILAGHDPVNHLSRPWFLAGGLNENNVTDALKVLSPDIVDVSSGVERERGVKDPDKIRAFIRAAKRA